MKIFTISNLSLINGDRSMAKTAKVQFVCTDCGMNFTQWQGQCRCGAWNTLVEMKIPKTANNSATSRARNTAGYAGSTSGGSKKINQIEATEAEKKNNRYW